MGDEPPPEPSVLRSIRRHLRERATAAAELWTAFDRFCLEASGKHGASIVEVFSPAEQKWITPVIARAEGGHLDEARIEDALQTMRVFWRNLVESDEETVLVLD